jgi:hypothetical protein
MVAGVGKEAARVWQSMRLSTRSQASVLLWDLVSSPQALPDRAGGAEAASGADPAHPSATNTLRTLRRLVIL